MSITGAVVLFAVYWFIALFLVLPRGQVTQLEDGEVVPGTPGGAPADIKIGRKFIYATIGATIAVGVTALILNSGLDMDDFEFLYPESFKEPLLNRPADQS
ncbi:MAG: DUF1467 family protein [Pseudomonadota bacterium]